MKANEVIDVVAALVMERGKLLITKRRKQAHLGGYWEFPGGKRDPGEDDATALKRELKEETGLLIQVGQLFHEIEWTYPERTVRLRFYDAQPAEDSPEAKPLEVAALEWVSPVDLGSWRFPPANDEILEKLRRVRN